MQSSPMNYKNKPNYVKQVVVILNKNPAVRAYKIHSRIHKDPDDIKEKFPLKHGNITADFLPSKLKETSN